LDNFDTIEKYEVTVHGRLFGEVTEKQKKVYQALGVEPNNQSGSFGLLKNGSLH